MDIEGCISLIRGLINTAIQDNHPRLPSVRELARQAGVSPVTILKALNDPSLKNSLIIKQGSGIYVAASARDSTTRDPQKGNTLHKRVAGKIHYDLLSRHASSFSMLPALKELSDTYGASFHTLRKSLLLLEMDSLIIRRGRGYCTVPVNAQAKRGTIVLICLGDANGRPIFHVPRMRSTLHMMENECSRAGLELRIISCKYNGDLVQRGSGRFKFEQYVKNNDVLGCVLWTPGIHHSVVQSVSLRIDKMDLPCAVLNETTDAHMAVGHHARSFFVAVSSLPGRIAARYLISRGHRRIGVITPFETTEWSQNRIRGIQEAYGLAGGDTTVLVSSRAFPDLLEDSGNPDQVGHFYGPAIKGNLDAISQVYKLKETPDDSHEIARRSARSAYLHATLGPQLEEILGNQQIRAIAGINDETALILLELLENRGISVPGDISLIGFDDTIDACMENLTSYCFNLQSVIRAVLSHILDKNYRYKHEGFVEIEGFVIERGSVARVN